jgi:hypothetical protein
VNTDRIVKLKEKIDGIQVTIEKEKANQLEQINSRIEELDENLKHTIDSRTATIGSMTTDVNSVI